MHYDGDADVDNSNHVVHDANDWGDETVTLQDQTDGFGLCIDGGSRSAQEDTGGVNRKLTVWPVC